MNDYDAYCDHMRRLADVRYASDLLQWDQEVYMPEGGAAFRARQLSTLSGIQHTMQTSDELGRLLERLSAGAGLDAVQKANVAESMRKYREQMRYPNAFVVKMQEHVSRSFQAWQRARREKDFGLFSPLLAEMVELKRQECDLLGYDVDPYDALLNLFEPGSTTADLTGLFDELKRELVPLVKKIAGKEAPHDAFLEQYYPREKQWDFGMQVLNNLHYDLNCGRQDLSAHPFTTNFSARDVRITTRVAEYDFREMTWSTIHECGHALYEQGLPPGDYGLPSGEYLSLAVHESQSRLWENNVGRALPFWRFHYPLLQKAFPENLGGVSLDAFYRAINAVRPSLIRTSADEVTYHLHVLIRFEVERELINGRLAVRDLPEAWNNLYRKHLGLEVPDDAAGVLQDVHWSHGGFGYFPTYTQGSIYAAQFYAKAQEELPGLETQIANGDTRPLLDWLRDRIHRHGRTLAPGDLCRRVTGDSLNFPTFMNYIRQKYAPLYELD